MKVFVYGTLKRGHRNHYLLENSKFIGAGQTRRLFRMFDCGFPVLRTYSDRPSPYNAKVRGEVYEVDEQTLRRLDQLESEGRMYHRQWVRVQFGKTKSGRGIGCMAYAYIGDGMWVRQQRLRLYAPPPPGEAYDWPCKRQDELEAAE